MGELKESLVSSSIQILSLIVAAEKSIVRFVWTLIGIACLATFSLLFAQSLALFFQYPVGTTVWIQAGPLEFPAVSVCSLNPYKTSALKSKSPKLYEAISNYSKAYLENERSGRLARDVQNPSDAAHQRKPRQATSAPVTTTTMSNKGRTFYAVFFPDTGSLPTNPAILLATLSPTSFPVTITNKGGGFGTKTVTIDNTKVYQIDIDTSTVTWTTGFKITASSDFAAYTQQIGDNSADATLLIPLDALGTEYMNIGYADPSEDYPSYVYIMGTVDGTNVTVTKPSGSTVKYTANEMDVTKLDNPVDYSGYRVSSSAPVAVFTAHDCLSWPYDCGGCDQVFEQLAPIISMGTTYALAPFVHDPMTAVMLMKCADDDIYNNATYELFKVVAISDGTTVTRTGTITSETFTLNAGKAKEVLAKSDEYSLLTADQPVVVSQLMQSDNYVYEDSDTALLVLVPIELYDKDYFIISCNSEFDTHFFTVIIDPSRAAGLLLNGAPFIDTLPAYAIPGASLSVYYHTVDCSGKASFLITHTDTDCVYNVIASGTDDYTSYAYTAGRLYNIEQPSTTSTTTTTTTRTSTTTTTAASTTTRTTTVPSTSTKSSTGTSTVMSAVSATSTKSISRTATSTMPTIATSSVSKSSVLSTTGATNTTASSLSFSTKSNTSSTPTVDVTTSSARSTTSAMASSTSGSFKSSLQTSSSPITTASSTTPILTSSNASSASATSSKSTSMSASTLSTASRNSGVSSMITSTANSVGTSSAPATSASTGPTSTVAATAAVYSTSAAVPTSLASALPTLTGSPSVSWTTASVSTRASIPSSATSSITVTNASEWPSSTGTTSSTGSVGSSTSESAKFSSSTPATVSAPSSMETTLSSPTLLSTSNPISSTSTPTSLTFTTGTKGTSTLSSTAGSSTIPPVTSTGALLTTSSVSAVTTASVSNSSPTDSEAVSTTGSSPSSVLRLSTSVVSALTSTAASSTSPRPSTIVTLASASSPGTITAATTEASSPLQTSPLSTAEWSTPVLDPTTAAYDITTSPTTTEPSPMSASTSTEEGTSILPNSLLISTPLPITTFAATTSPSSGASSVTTASSTLATIPETSTEWTTSADTQSASRSVASDTTLQPHTSTADTTSESLTTVTSPVPTTSMQQLLTDSRTDSTTELTTDSETVSTAAPTSASSTGLFSTVATSSEVSTTATPSTSIEVMTTSDSASSVSVAEKHAFSGASSTFQATTEEHQSTTAAEETTTTLSRGDITTLQQTTEYLTSRTNSETPIDTTPQTRKSTRRRNPPSIVTGSTQDSSTASDQASSTSSKMTTAETTFASYSDTVQPTMDTAAQTTTTLVDVSPSLSESRTTAAASSQESSSSTSASSPDLATVATSEAPSTTLISSARRFTLRSRSTILHGIALINGHSNARYTSQASSKSIGTTVPTTAETTTAASTASADTNGPSTSFASPTTQLQSQPARRFSIATSPAATVTTTVSATKPTVEPTNTLMSSIAESVQSSSSQATTTLPTTTPEHATMETPAVPVSPDEPPSITSSATSTSPRSTEITDVPTTTIQITSATNDSVQEFSTTLFGGTTTFETSTPTESSSIETETTRFTLAVEPLLATVLISNTAAPQPATDDASMSGTIDLNVATILPSATPISSSEVSKTTPLLSPYTTSPIVNPVVSTSRRSRRVNRTNPSIAPFDQHVDALPTSTRSSSSFEPTPEIDEFQDPTTQTSRASTSTAEEISEYDMNPPETTLSSTTAKTTLAAIAWMDSGEPSSQQMSTADVTLVSQGLIRRSLKPVSRPATPETLVNTTHSAIEAEATSTVQSLAVSTTDPAQSSTSSPVLRRRPVTNVHQYTPAASSSGVQFSTDHTSTKAGNAEATQLATVSTGTSGRHDDIVRAAQNGLEPSTLPLSSTTPDLHDIQFTNPAGQLLTASIDTPESLEDAPFTSQGALKPITISAAQATSNNEPTSPSASEDFPEPSDLVGLLPWASEMEDALPYFVNEYGIDPSLLGIDLEEFIFWCNYNGRKCDFSTEIRKFVDPSYGNCFTFNPNSATHFTRRGGQRLGLRVIFRTPSSENLPFILPAGYKVVLHQPDEEPMMSVSGVTCSPGQYYSFSVNRLDNKRLDEPYQECDSNLTTTRPAYYANKSYSLETCMGSCTQKMILEKCSCGDPRYPLPPGASYCNITQKPCVDNTTNNAQRSLSMSGCSCLPACKDAIFSFTQSKSIWPSYQWTPPTCELKDSNPGECTRSFKNSYSRVDIFYGSMTGTQMEAYAQYTLNQLVSDTFANSGLWLALCAISVFEMAFIPLTVILEHLQKKS